MQEIIVDFAGWYLVVQLITVVALPLTFRLFSALPDRGYAFAKSVGILGTGFALWLGTSYGILRNETGGAWLSLLLVAIVSTMVGWPLLRALPQFRGAQYTARAGAHPLPNWRYLLIVELLFLLAFAAWTWVRAHDPAINHTEQPMDLMFMTGIWTSPTFPPRDPWLAGYAISYYYFGYWLLVTVARLAAQPPEIAYNLGQACWFGLLVIGSFGVGYNLLALSVQSRAGRTTPAAIAGGLLTTVAVALTGNLHAIVEWLYAQGVNVDWLARWADVPNFPENAAVTRQWFIDAGWSWWWRSSRVIGDTDLMGNHIEVIDEFPMFSYVLGDNHPHVLAMPFVLLVVGLALHVFFWRSEREGAGAHSGTERSLAALGMTTGEREREEGGEQSLLEHIRYHLRLAWPVLLDVMPGRVGGLVFLGIASGALVFLNTWDFPPYWALLVLVVLFAVTRRQGFVPGLWSAGVLALLLLVGMLVVYFPYFLTAQSQAGGVAPNFFNPTRLPQFLLMFGHFLLGAGALIVLAWWERAPRARELVVALLLILGLPLSFLGGSLLLALGSETGQALLSRMALPPEMDSYTEAILGRWSQRPLTFVLVGTLAALVAALLWRRLAAPARGESGGTTFALLLAGIGLLLVFAPEFVYLRDNFGSRMNTVFKFYYQGWLLLGVSSSYAIVVVFRDLRPSKRAPLVATALGGLSLLLIAGGLIYPVAGSHAKVQGFGTDVPTLNGLAYVSANEVAAIEWIRRNTAPGAIVLQGKGRSYWATDNRVNAATGRATLLGWDGHESQWRGPAYGEMAAGRSEAVEAIYRGASPAAIATVLQEAEIDYVYVGSVEREQYNISPAAEARLAQVMDQVFEQGDVRIYRSPVIGEQWGD